MCFELGSAPPAAVIRGAAVSPSGLTPEASDGDRPAAFRGLPGVGNDSSPGPAQFAREPAAPILALMGGADEAIAAQEGDSFDRALTAAGVEHEVATTHAGGPHSFFDHKHDNFAEASAHASRRVFAFVDRHAG